MLKVMVLPGVMVAITVLAACGGTADTPSPGATATTAAPTATASRPNVTVAPRQLRAEMEGDGSDVLGPYEMGRGVIIVFARSEGDGGFSLTFVDENQGLVKSIESSPGPYQGELVHSVFDGNNGGLAPGNYTVNIEATGPWHVRLIQERVFRGQPPEIAMAGSGDGGGSWIELDDGEYTMTTSHTGTSDFTVELFDGEGVAPYRIVQVTGDHEGEARFTVGGGAPGENLQAGLYALGVRSQGDWNVTIKSNDAP